MKPTRTKTPRKTKRNSVTDPVEVYCRLRPIPDNIPKCCRCVSDDILQLTPSDTAIARNGETKETQYTFSKVYDEFTNQKSIFDEIGLPLVNDLIHGKNGLLFAYGVTSSGKTYTMNGTSNDQGVLPNCLDVIFNSIGHRQAKKYVFKPDKMNGFDIQSEADAMMERQQRDILPKITQQRNRDVTPPDSSRFSSRIKNATKLANIDECNVYSVFVSFIELYNNYIYDLLEELSYDPITGFRPPQSKILREDSEHNMYVANCIEIEVKSTEEAFDILEKGQKRRRVAHTQLNAESSRSHSVFNIRIVQSPLDASGSEAVQTKDKIAQSQLSLVDLAGSERTARTGNNGDRLKEASLINQSLMTLRICMEKLRENQINDIKQMVPYRDSKLTHLFKNYFDGEGKVKMIVCVNPDVQDYDEIMQVMRFAQMARDVQVARQEEAKYNPIKNPVSKRLAPQPPSEDSSSIDSITTSAPSVAPAPLCPNLKLVDIYDSKTNLDILSYLKSTQKWFNQTVSSIDIAKMNFRDRLIKFENKLSDDFESKETTAKILNKEAELKKVQQRMRRMQENNNVLVQQNAILAQEKRDIENEHKRKKSWLENKRNLSAENLHDNTFSNKLQRSFSEKNISAKNVEEFTDLSSNVIDTSDDDKPMENHTSKKYSHKIYEANDNVIESRRLIDSNMKTILKKPMRERNAQITEIKKKFEPVSIAKVSHQYRMKDQVNSAISNNVITTPNVKPSQYGRMAAKSEQDLRSRTTTRNNAGFSSSQRPSVKPKPLLTERNRRRSKSTDAWIDHKPVSTIDTNTILQPKMTKRKSVTNVSGKDLTKAEHYALTHQELDSDGDIRTKLVKGDIKRTLSGGQSVVFNEVENLTQKSPGTKKRRSNNDNEQGCVNMDELESRVHIGYEGHDMRRKRSRTYGA